MKLKIITNYYTRLYNTLIPINGRIICIDEAVQYLDNIVINLNNRQKKKITSICSYLYRLNNTWKRYGLI